MIALISDIHGNLEALQEVFADIDKTECDKVYCLGDIVGYGACPVECVDMVKERCEFTTCGNHDYGLTKMPFGFNKFARAAIEWQRKVMKPGLLSVKKRRRWNWLKNLPYTHEEGNVLYLHASPLDPIMDYVKKSDVVDLGLGVGDKIKEIFSKVEHLCFIGHTHQPAVITDDFQYIVPEDLDNYKFEFDTNRKYVINIGSVGQPRDKNTKACYVLFDGDSNIEYRRVEYDFEKTITRIKAIDDLDNRLGERLRTGT